MVPVGSYRRGILAHAVPAPLTVEQPHAHASPKVRTGPIQGQGNSLEKGRTALSAVLCESGLAGTFVHWCGWQSRSQIDLVDPGAERSRAPSHTLSPASCTVTTIRQLPPSVQGQAAFLHALGTLLLCVTQASQTRRYTGKSDPTRSCRAGSTHLVT